VEAVVDPHIAPLPPRLDQEKAENLREALAKGQPNPEKIAASLLSQRVRQLI
jgi:anthranilate phosphoribosyltransferase